MIFFSVHHAPVVVLKKLCRLYDLLFQEKNHFEALANNVFDRASQRLLRGLAQDICQNANELSAQILSMGGDPEKFDQLEFGSATFNEAEAPYTNIMMSEEQLKDCADREMEMIKAYRDVLNEFNLYADVRNMLRYQLNGMMCGYLQIKMLNQAIRIPKSTTSL